MRSIAESNGRSRGSVTATARVLWNESEAFVATEAEATFGNGMQHALHGDLAAYDPVGPIGWPGRIGGIAV